MDITVKRHLELVLKNLEQGKTIRGTPLHMSEICAQADAASQAYINNISAGQAKTAAKIRSSKFAG